MDVEDRGRATGPLVWTVDPDRVVAQAADTARASGVSVVRSGDGVRVLDMVDGLVAEALPYRNDRWLVRAWRVSEPTRRPAGHGQIQAPVVFSMWSVDPDAGALFALAAEVVIADRPGGADLVVLVRPDRDMFGRYGWTPTGANPASLVLTRIVTTVRDALR